MFKVESVRVLQMGEDEFGLRMERCCSIYWEAMRLSSLLSDGLLGLSGTRGEQCGKTAAMTQE
jgi:hypothetical protein